MDHDEFPDKQLLGVLVNRFEDALADHERFVKQPAAERMAAFMQDMRGFAAGMHDIMRYTVSAHSSCPCVSTNSIVYGSMALPSSRHIASRRWSGSWPFCL